MTKRKLIICAISALVCALTFIIFFGLAFALVLCDKGNEIPYYLAIISIISGCMSMYYSYKGNEKNNP